MKLIATSLIFFKVPQQKLLIKPTYFNSSQFHERRAYTELHVRHFKSSECSLRARNVILMVGMEENPSSAELIIF